MAYQQRTQASTEHPFRTIVKLAEAGIWPRVLLCHGHEAFLVTWAEKFVCSSLVSSAAQALDCTVFEDGADPYEIIAACETLPAMSKKKLVVLRRTDIFTQQAKDMSEEGVRTLAEYIPDIPESSLLLFTADKVNRNRLIYKACASSGIVYDFRPLDRGTLSGWIAKQIASFGKNASASDIERYACECGYLDKDSRYTLYNVKGDIAKACAFTDAKTVTAEDMRACMQAEEDADAFGILDAAFSGNKGKALGMLRLSVSREQAAKQDGTVLRFLGLLCSQLEIMLEAKERGGDPYELARVMGANPYRIKKAAEAASRRSCGQLKASLRAAYDIEKDFKSGLMDAYLALELFIAGL